MHTPVQKTREELIWEEGTTDDLAPLPGTPESDEVEETDAADRMAVEMVDLSTLEALNIALPPGMDLAALQEAFAVTEIAEPGPDEASDTAEELPDLDMDDLALEALYEGRTRRTFQGADGSEDAFQSYLHDIRGLSLISHEEELMLARRAAAGDTRARRRLVEANLRLVIAIARRYVNSGVPLIDLIQEGNMGLMRAAEKFDYKRGTHFGTYATWWIRQAVSRAAGEQSRLIHLPEHVATRLRKVRRVAAQISQESGNDPLPEQIAEAAGMPLEEVDDLLHVTEQPVSLDAPADTENRYSLADTLEDRSSQAPADIASRHLVGEELHRALSTLTSRERAVVTLRYGIGDGRSRTLLEVGRELNISRERVRQLEMVALMKLRHASSAYKLRECV
ncbi:MAG TPA: sigma-70 family RNA polymerase sigma factor [Ktedonobacterales bacterium]|nr:sigma-70 family RNA polymerase sigma factor [Ktedonobacterales bacterium]